MSFLPLMEYLQDGIVSSKINEFKIEEFIPSVYKDTVKNHLPHFKGYWNHQLPIRERDTF